MTSLSLNPFPSVFVIFIMPKEIMNHGKLEPVCKAVILTTNFGG